MSVSELIRELPPHWQPPDVGRQRLLTIGHSNHSLPTFLSLVRQHSVEVLVDTRSYPYSRHAPHFNAQRLGLVLHEIGIRYVVLGDLLGGRPSDPTLYDDRGKVDYDLLAASSPFQTGLQRLRLGLAHFRLAILCSEENPARCHRGRLIGPLLAAEEIEIRHIRGDGRLEEHLDRFVWVQRSRRRIPDWQSQIRWL